MTTATATVGVLEGWLAQGVHEEPAHSNRTPIGQEFGWNGVAWCCITCSVALKRVGQPGVWTASVAQAIADAKAGKNGLQWIARTADVRVGDMPCFDWKLRNPGAGNSENFHISTIVNPGMQSKFETIGGNENDAVTRQWRDRTYVQGFIRPAYTDAGQGAGGISMADAASIEQHLSGVNDFLSKRMSEMLTDLQKRDDQNKARLDAIEKAIAQGDVGGGASVAQIADELARRLKE